MIKLEDFISAHISATETFQVLGGKHWETKYSRVGQEGEWKDIATDGIHQNTSVLEGPYAGHTTGHDSLP